MNKTQPCGFERTVELFWEEVLNRFRLEHSAMFPVYWGRKVLWKEQVEAYLRDSLQTSSLSMDYTRKGVYKR